MTSDLLAQFVAEAGELLEQVDAGLLQLERDPQDRALLDQVFRAAHTLKGSSGLFDVQPLTRLTHAAEDLLDAVRAGRLDLTTTMIDDLLGAFDLIRSWLGELEGSGALPHDAGATAAELALRLRLPLGGPDPGQAAGLAAATPTAAAAAPHWVLDGLGPQTVGALRDWLAHARTACRVVRFAPGEQSFFTGGDPLHLVSQVPAVEALAASPREPWPAMADLDEYRCLLDFTLATRATVTELEHLFRYVADEVTLAEVDVAGLESLLSPAPDLPVVAVPADPHDVTDVADGPAFGDLSAAPGAPVPAQRGAQPAEAGGPEAAAVERRDGPGDRRVAGRVLKVDQATVDRLLDLVGQLVVAKNALPFLADAAEQRWNARVLGRQIKDQYGVVNRITEDLQSAVMDVRMLPLSVAFARFPRMVRDLSRSLGKHVVLEQQGEDTAADKDVIEMLADPLVHLIRNSLDHGIEPPGDRIAAGKPAQATVRLHAWQEPDAVVIDVVDDGRGIDPAAIRRKAHERGLITAEQAGSISDADAVNLVFAPGFSTAEQISDVSGRGVGMDAVRASIEAAGGSVVLTSQLGEGSRVRLRLPLSMAISRVMIVTVAGQKFGVPIDMVVETVRVPGTRVEKVQHQDVLVLRETVLPLVDLAGTFRLGPPAAAGLPGPRGGLQVGREPADDSQVSVLVTRSGGSEVGLVVDAFHEGAEVIVKPLDGVLSASRQFCGTALLGDGTVLLVLDVSEVLVDAGQLL